MKSQNRLLPWFCLIATANVNTAFANDGLDAYRQGNYIQAAQQLANSSDKDPIVDYYMAKMRLYGYGQLKNNVAAINHFQQAAQKGLLPAQRTMALYSLLKENNPEQALFWFKKAADANDVQAQMYCAAAYLFGVGTKKNSELAKRYYIAAAKNGDSLAQTTLAESFLDSRHAENKKLGLLWLTKAVAQNNPEAQRKMGELYTNGTGVPVDLAKAKELVGLAVAQGYTPAIYQMGIIAKKQNDSSQAKEWFTKAAMAHYAPAEMALAQLYMQDKTALTNIHAGFLWMLKAAQNGSTEAQLALATMYKNGQGVEPDENLAKEWQQKAAASEKDTPVLAQQKAAQWLTMGRANTFAASGYHLTGIFSNWQNPETLKENNYNQAPHMDVITREALYKPNFVMVRPNDIPISDYYDALATALNGTQHAEISFPRYPLDRPEILAEMRLSAKEDGQPDPSSSGAISDQALFTFLQGRAVLGDPSAQFMIGQMYQEGIGTEKNLAEAIKNYELANEQQDLYAEYNLALIYLEGQGVQPDYQKAVSLLRDAAFKGNDYAQYALGRIAELGYRNPAGEVVVQPDPEQAVAMYDIAAANDYGLAQYRLAELLVRDKKTDMTVTAKQNRNQTLKQLYQEAFASGVQEAAVPLAFFNAMDADKTKQAQALEIAQKEASTGNAGAALLLGLLYDRGIAVPASQSDALTWYQKAPSNPVTAFILGTYYSQGTGVSKDAEKGKTLLEQAATAGFSYADLNLAVMKQQAGEAFLPELEKALALGNSTAGLLLADYYLSIANNDNQMKQARDIYQQFAEKGDKDGQLKLGFMMQQGLGGTVDMTNAEKWYGLAAEQGQVTAQYLLGHLYQLGWVGKQPDYALAKKWYSSAQSSYSPAAVALGFIYDTVDDDYNQALASYQLAADQHDPIGQLDLGLIYEDGKGRAVDFAKAKELYQQSADQGNSHAMVQLAGLYFNGSLGDRDEDQALDWYKKAAALGDQDALYQLGLLSETGVGMTLDFAQALQYYQQSADKGNAKAMLALARIYQYGLGVTKDLQQAIKYYRQLAALGNAYAQYQLATFYYEGIDGKRLPQEGKKLLLQAQANGSPQAKSVLQWLDSQSPARTSYVEPAIVAQPSKIAEQPAELMYLDALSAWNKGDELASKAILDQLMTQFPDYVPAKPAYEQLKQQLAPQSIFG